ncbi:unnamed protein product [Allacma fusca]|uniref:Uncharacterized protein n=1 Tax=Allacma fusca TaxID=39272 RepID=A0A8J2JKT2_9HEXA|nr:unnamed protein product [Allacma fusca]
MDFCCAKAETLHFENRVNSLREKDAYSPEFSPAPFSSPSDHPIFPLQNPRLPRILLNTLSGLLHLNSTGSLRIRKEHSPDSSTTTL